MLSFFLEVLFSVGVSCLFTCLLVANLLFVVGPIVVVWAVLFVTCCDLDCDVVLGAFVSMFLFEISELLKKSEIFDILLF